MSIDPTLRPPEPPADGSGWQIVGPAADTAGWHPDVAALLIHWRNRSLNGRLPSRAAIDPLGLRRALPYMWMLDIEHDAAARDPWRFRYRLAGTRFVDALGFEVTQRWYDEVRPLAWAANRIRLITVAEQGVPTWRRGAMPLEDGRCRAVENLMLPLAGNGRDPDIVLGITVTRGRCDEPLAA